MNAYARQLCDGLAAVHDIGLLHRDLKPGNVLLDDRGKVKLADFGLAAMAEQVRSEDAEQGTWQYMAPEQLDGSVPNVRKALLRSLRSLMNWSSGRECLAPRHELSCAIGSECRSPRRPCLCRDSIPPSIGRSSGASNATLRSARLRLRK